MMTSSLFEFGITALVISSFWMLFVLVVRKPISRWIGARWAYYLWLVPLIGFLAVAIPVKQNWQLGSIPTFNFPAIEILIDGALGVVDNLDTPTNDSKLSLFSENFKVGSDSLLVLWLAGISVSIFLLIFRALQFSKTVRQSSYQPTAEQADLINADLAVATQKLNVRIRIILSQHGPAVAGLIRPELLLPKNFFDRYTPAQRVLMLQHEIQHLQRHDLLWLFLARIFRCFFWFNPIAYIAEHYLQLDQELSCDEVVLADRDNVIRRLYGETLLVSGQSYTPLTHAPYLPTFRQIKERTSMLKHHNHRNLNRVLGSAFVAISIFASAAYGIAEKSEIKSTPMSEAVYAELMGIQQQIEKTEYITALEDLKQLESDFREPPLTGYELAQVANLSGYVHFLMKDYENAITSYDRVTKLNHGVPKLQMATFKTIAQLYMSLERYEASLGYQDQLEAIGEPSAENMILKGQTYFQLKDYEPALIYIDRAITLVESEDRTPAENWLLLQKAAQEQLSLLQN